jgi:hypothetical protein
MKHSKFLLIGLVITASVSFAACMPSADVSNTDTNDDSAPGAIQKQGDTQKVGMITEINGVYYINQAGQVPEMIESLAVDLSQYVGQEVTVVGQYSGDTLFVGSVE